MGSGVRGTSLLAGDIGGTKTLLALYASRSGGLELERSHRYASADWPDLAPMVQHFLAGDAAPAAACFAVAGPVEAGHANLTNLPWQLSETGLSQQLGIGQVDLVNDFAVLIYGLPHLEPQQQACIHGGTAREGEPLLVLGAGTGLGVAFGLPGAQGLTAVASEAAHAEFAPRSEREWALKQWLQRDLAVDRLSIERVVSGTGLGHVARWLLHRHDPEGCHPLRRAGEDLPAATAAAAAAGDPLGCEALDLWLGAYGSACGDLALGALATGGVWLAGGTAGKLLEPLRSDRFRQAFLAKGRLSRLLESIPIAAILDPAIGQFSAACRARMLVS
jgi:glucokinase